MSAVTREVSPHETKPKASSSPASTAFSNATSLLTPTHLEHDDIYPEEIVARMKELGLFGATIDADYGGLGLSTTIYAKIVERISRGVDVG